MSMLTPEAAPESGRKPMRKRLASRLARMTGLVVVIGLIVGCTGDGGESTSSTATGSTDDGSGGTTDPAVTEPYKRDLANDPSTVDPAQISTGADILLNNTYEYLVDIPPDSSEPVPMLATEVPSQDNGLVSEDGLTWTFPIREGVKFHDGTDLTADDVKYSWDRVMTMDLPESQVDTLSQIIATTTVVDEYTFQVTLQRPAAWFLNSVVYSVPASIVSQDAVEANGGVVAGQPNGYMSTNMVGTGPYQLVNWERNVAMDYAVFEDYWGEPRASLPVRVVINSDPVSVMLALNEGDLDEASPYAEQLDQANDEVCISTDGFLLEPFIAAFNMNIPEGGLPPEDTIPLDFFHDPRVRQAFAYAFDYATFAEVGMGGASEPAIGYIPRPMPHHDPDALSYSLDLVRAQELFTEAGWWDEGFSMSIMTEAGRAYETAALLLKDTLEGMNPNFRINVLAYTAAQFDEYFVQEPFPYAMWIKNADAYRDPHFLFSEYWHPDGHWGQVLGYENGYSDPARVAQMIDDAALETDFNTRTEMYSELQAALFEEPMWIWITEEKNLLVRRCTVEGFVYNPLWLAPRWQFVTSK